jgi:hypothetical protein
MDDYAILTEGSFSQPIGEMIHVYRKFKLCYCSWFCRRLADGRAIFFYQELIRISRKRTRAFHECW